MQVGVITLFPEMFNALSENGISGRAVDRGLLSLSLVNPRDHADDKHQSVDDRPYGGGPGMVMTVPPLSRSIAATREALGVSSAPAHVVYLSPQGRPLVQEKLQQLSECPQLILLCGRYEGIDERLIEAEVDEEISLGDYVISGGELAAMVVLDGVIRLLPEALGDGESAAQDSFSSRNLLDWPHYSRPEQVAGKTVPEVLLSGNHRAIARWRLQQSLLRTRVRRPDLFDRLVLTDEERRLLVEAENYSGS